MEKFKDEYCEKIFVVISNNDDEVRFNELHRQLAKYGAKMSKPTLIQHLNHLLEKGIVLRKETDKQNVTYGIDWKEYIEAQRVKKSMEKMSKSKENFKLESINNQVIYACGMLTLGEFYFTKFAILDLIEPEKKLQHYISYQLIRRISSIYFSWLLDTCKGSQENSQKALKYIDKRIKEIHKALSG